MYDQVHIQITLGVKCELKWSLKWQISQRKETNGDNTSSTRCQIHIKAAQINCTSGQDRESGQWGGIWANLSTSAFLPCNRRASNISKCLVLLYLLEIHSQLRPCVSPFLDMQVGCVVTDGGFVWLGSWRVTPQGAPVQELPCCLLRYAVWWVWH